VSKGFLVTVEELEQSPWKLEAKMRNLANISIWKDHYRGKRVSNGIQLKPWRDKIEQIEREIKQAQRQAISKRKQLEQQRERESREMEQYSKFHERVLQFHHTLLDKRTRLEEREILANSPEYETFISIAARTLGNDIHDFTEVKTGLMTFRCFEEKILNPTKHSPTPEHFWPRSVVGGRDVLEQAILMKDAFTIRHTIRTLYQLCQTVESLNTENRELMKHQKADTFVDPQTSYDAVGIKLVRFKEFSLHSNWARVFDQYSIPPIDPYTFKNVIAAEDAEAIISHNHMKRSKE